MTTKQQVVDIVNSFPDEIELAIILVGNEHVPQAIKDCIDKGVKGIILESAGFAETGIKKYIELQNEIKNIIKNCTKWNYFFINY